MEEHSEIEEVLIKAVNDQFRKEKISENYFKYEVVLQGNKFIAAMSVDEVAESAKLTVDILEELKNINNSGINRDELKRIEKQEDRHETDGDNVMQILGIWNSIKTEQLLELISKLDRVRRVGGAWAMLIANPCLIMKKKERALNAGCMINNYSPASLIELVRNNTVFQEK